MAVRGGAGVPGVRAHEERVGAVSLENPGPCCHAASQASEGIPQ